MEENKICKCCYSKSGEGVRGGCEGRGPWDVRLERREQTDFNQSLRIPANTFGMISNTETLELLKRSHHKPPNWWTRAQRRDRLSTSQQKMTSLVKSPSNAQRGSGILCCAHELTRSREETLWIPVMSSCFRLSLAPWLKMTPWYLVFERTGRLKGGWKRGLPSRGC